MARYVSTAAGLGRLEADATIGLLDLPGSSLDAAFRAGVSATDLAAAPVRERVAPAEAPLRAPVQRPVNVFGIGFAYADHKKEVARERTDDHPFAFLKASSSVIGPSDDIRLPALAPDHVDFEGEIAVVISRTASGIEEADAWDHILGYTAANDVSARDVQRGAFSGGDPDPSKGKSFDTFAPLGPAVCTLDEYADGNDVGLRTIVDGEQRQLARSSSLIFSVPTIVAFVSRLATLSPGDVILTGTPAGVGHPEGRFLRAGSVVRVEVEGAGAIENRVVAPAGARPPVKEREEQ